MFSGKLFENFSESIFQPLERGKTTYLAELSKEIDAKLLEAIRKSGLSLTLGDFEETTKSTQLSSEGERFRQNIENLIYSCTVVEYGLVELILKEYSFFSKRSEKIDASLLSHLKMVLVRHQDQTLFDFMKKFRLVGDHVKIKGFKSISELVESLREKKDFKKHENLLSELSDQLMKIVEKNPMTSQNSSYIYLKSLVEALENSVDKFIKKHPSEVSGTSIVSQIFLLLFDIVTKEYHAASFHIFTPKSWDKYQKINIWKRGVIHYFVVSQASRSAFTKEVDAAIEAWNLRFGKYCSYEKIEGYNYQGYQTVTIIESQEVPTCANLGCQPVGESQIIRLIPGEDIYPQLLACAGIRQYEESFEHTFFFLKPNYCYLTLHLASMHTEKNKVDTDLEAIKQIYSLKEPAIIGSCFKKIAKTHKREFKIVSEFLPVDIKDENCLKASEAADESLVLNLEHQILSAGYINEAEIQHLLHISESHFRSLIFEADSPSKSDYHQKFLNSVIYNVQRGKEIYRMHLIQHIFLKTELHSLIEIPCISAEINSIEELEEILAKGQSKCASNVENVELLWDSISKFKSNINSLSEKEKKYPRCEITEVLPLIYSLAMMPLVKESKVPVELFYYEVAKTIIQTADQLFTFLVDSDLHQNILSEDSTMKFWQNGKIYYQVDPMTSEAIKANFKKAVQLWNEKLEDSCSWIEGADPDNKSYVRIYEVFGNDRCASSVGYVWPHEQIFRLNEKDCSITTILHEMMHTAGFFHTHSRSDRDIHKVKINPQLLENADYSMCHFEIGHYDYDSVLHYQESEYISFKENYELIDCIGEVRGLSMGDCAAVKIMYGNPSSHHGEWTDISGSWAWSCCGADTKTATCVVSHTGFWHLHKLNQGRGCLGDNKVLHWSCCCSEHQLDKCSKSFTKESLVLLSKKGFKLPFPIVSHANLGQNPRENEHNLDHAFSPHGRFLKLYFKESNMLIEKYIPNEFLNNNLLSSSHGLPELCKRWKEDQVKIFHFGSQISFSATFQSLLSDTNRIPPVVCIGPIQVKDGLKNWLHKSSCFWDEPFCSKGIPLVIDKEIKTNKKYLGLLKNIKTAIEKFVSKTIVKFDVIDEERKELHFAWIQIRVDEKLKAPQSGVGRTDGGETPVSLLSSSPVYAVMHELMHAIGFVHEHSRIDRDHFVNVKVNKTEKSYVDYKIEDDYFPIGTYDPESIMHYHYIRGEIEPKEDGLLSLQEREFLKKNTHITPEDFSEGDKDSIAAVYGSDRKYHLRCTYERTQKQFKSQPYYECETCWGKDSVMGCCYSCMKFCHKGHKVISHPPTPGGFFCDCGANNHNEACTKVSTGDKSYPQPMFTPIDNLTINQLCFPCAKKLNCYQEQPIFKETRTVGVCACKNTSCNEKTNELLKKHKKGKGLFDFFYTAMRTGY